MQVNAASAAGGLFHPSAIVESASVGAGTRIGAFAHIFAGAVIGRDCVLNGHAVIEDGVSLGDRVTIEAGVKIGGAVVIEDDVSVGRNAVFTHRPLPRVKPLAVSATRVKKGASVGANAIVLPGIVIGERAVIVAGALVTADVPPGAIVSGNPSKITGYLGAKPETEMAGPVPEAAGVQQTAIDGVTLHRMPRFEDLRGLLSFGEVGPHIPFPVRRYFLVYGVPTEEVRGEHAHKQLRQFLISVHGTCHVVADDGRTRLEFRLDDPSIGLHIPAGVWNQQHKHSADAVLLVLASDAYDPADYIRDYHEFLAYRARQNAG